MQILTSHYDARMADEAYKVGMAALAAGKLDEGIHALNVAISKCPPNKSSAVARLQSIISFMSQQLQESPDRLWATAFMVIADALQKLPGSFHVCMSCEGPD
ncbi:hypothetical protein RJ639_027669 [Escallonia herrerae]|uniref:Uncharacterized protein n=1 Tax=Escallonia herrerae TaxID=1293975 RepID=A0AA89BEP1_9ASTE|nr:hypothetical protein RJ639_027669 [Escallonia herrerae]